jgi:hypothetical protein
VASPLDILRRILLALAAAPVEAGLALWRILVALLLAILLLLRWLLDLLSREEEPRRPDRCDELPPHVKRKPDPCLYSQTWLMAQGLAVTWNNPDIWVTELNGTPVPSDQLQAGHDYLVNGRIHDASFDPALATQVRCLYRPWSFNSPNRVPVEVNSDGTERVVIVHIPPWSSEVAVFRWRTPAQGGHFCLQVECFHPDDKNPNNNLGQENTTVLAASAAASLPIVDALDLFNTGRETQRFLLAADGYVVPTAEVGLQLESKDRNLVRRQPLQAGRNLLVSRDPIRGFVSQPQAGPTLVSHVYRGWDTVRRQSRRGEFPLGDEWAVQIAGEPLTPRGVEIEVGPESSRSVSIQASVPAGLPKGRHAVNVVAITALGRVVGGVTYHVQVE